MARASQPVLLASGGTGGHLFPALALADALQKRDHDVHLATDNRVRQFKGGIKDGNVHHVASDTIRSKSPIRLLKTGLTLMRGFISAWFLIGRIKPGIVVGFGGYPTLPTIWAAHMRGVPICLHEQNGVLGRANKALAKYAEALALSLPEVKFVDGEMLAKVTLTGNPVRPPVVAARETSYQTPQAGEPFKLLIFGGSQGARFFSDMVPAGIARMSPEERDKLQIVQQCRIEDCARVEEFYRDLGVKAEIAAFFNDLPIRIAQAHLVISRSGASTAAELAVIGRPALMVPLPHAIDNDQLANANALVAAGAGWLLPQSEIDPKRLAQEISTCMKNPVALSEAAEKARAVGRPDAAKNLADLVEKLLGKTEKN